MWRVGVVLLVATIGIDGGCSVLLPVDESSLELITEQVLGKIAEKIQGDIELAEQKEDTFNELNQTCNNDVLLEQNACLQCQNEHLEECNSMVDSEVAVQKPKTIQIVIALLDPRLVFVGTVKRIEEKLTNVVKKLGEKAKPLFKALDKAAHKVGSALKKGYEEISDGIKNAAKAIGKGVEKIADAVKSGVKKAGEAIKSGIKSTVRTAVRIVRSAGRAVRSAARRVANAVRRVRFRTRRWGKRKRSASECFMECDSCMAFEEDGESAIRMICGDALLDVADEINEILKRAERMYNASFDEEKPVFSKIEYDPTSMEYVGYHPQYNTVFITANIDGRYETYRSEFPYRLTNMIETGVQWAMEYIAKYQ